MYAFATGLIGFRSDTLRVRIVRAINRDNVLVMTADLLDSGTQLILDYSQLSPEGETAKQGYQHKDGLVTFSA